MPSSTTSLSEQGKADQSAKVRAVFQLLEDNLRPEERDMASPAYRLAWYENLRANRFGGADLKHFRRFVDDMTERALMRACHTEAIFPSASATGLNAERIDFNVLQARSLCESVQAGMGES